MHAANTGFQAKLDSGKGSYLLYEFTRRMNENLNNRSGVCDITLGRLLDRIQKDDGKQLIKSTFNDETQSVQFTKHNKRMHSKCEQIKSQMETPGDTFRIATY